MDELNIDIHNEVYLVPWKKEWAHIFRMEKQNILAALAASEHTADMDESDFFFLLMESRIIQAS